MTNLAQRRNHELWIARILAAGVWISAILLISGLLLTALAGPTGPPVHNPTLHELLIELSSGDFFAGRVSTGITIIYFGLIALILTPFFRVLTAGLTFAVERDWRYVIVSTLILFALVGELVFTYH